MRPGWEYIRVRRIADSVHECNDVTQSTIKSKVRDGLDHIQVEAERRESEVLEQPLSFQTRIPWSRCVVDLRIAPIPLGRWSLLHVESIADAFHQLSPNILFRGATNLGVEMWGLEHGKHEPTMMGWVEIKIMGPNIQ